MGEARHGLVDLHAQGRTAEQTTLLRLRLQAQRHLARRLRPGPGQWKDSVGRR
jgi:hypothetical protein